MKRLATIGAVLVLLLTGTGAMLYAQYGSPSVFEEGEETNKEGASAEERRSGATQADPQPSPPASSERRQREAQPKPNAAAQEQRGYTEPRPAREYGSPPCHRPELWTGKNVSYATEGEDTLIYVTFRWTGAKELTATINSAALENGETSELSEEAEAELGCGKLTVRSESGETWEGYTEDKNCLYLRSEEDPEEGYLAFETASTNLYELSVAALADKSNTGLPDPPKRGEACLKKATRTGP